MNKLKRWLTGLLLGVVALSAVAEGPAAWTYSAKPWSQWILGAQLKPTFSLNLAAIAAGNYDPLTITRASSGTMFDSTGALVTKSTNVARVDYDPATLALRGLLIEEARTNSIRNNTMVGASAGTPGTAPTNWGIFTGGPTGITRTIVGTGTESGITYIDVQLAGTPSAPGNYYFTFDTASGIAALTAQVWTESFYQKLAAGTTTGITSVRPDLIEYTSGAVYITETPGSSLLPTSSGLETQRNSSAITLSGGGTTAFVVPSVVLAMDGAAIDITLRIGMPQLELGAFATSVIPTSTVAVTRAADVASITGANFTSFWNATQGTILANVEKSSAAAVGYAFVVSDGTGSNRQRVFLNTDSNQYATVTTGGVEQLTGTNLNLGSWAVNTAKKVVIAYQSNNFAGTSGGAAPATDSTVNLPTVDRLYLGQNENGTGSWLNGWISSLSYYPVAVDAVTLTQLASDTMPTFAANDDVFWLTASAR